MCYLFNNAASHSDYTCIEMKNRMFNKWTGKDKVESGRALSKTKHLLNRWDRTSLLNSPTSERSNV